VFSGYSFWYKKGLKIEFNDIFHVRWFIYAFETITLIMELVNWSRKEPTNEVRFCSTGILYFIHKIVRKIGQNQRCCQVSLSAQKLSTIDGVAEGRVVELAKSAEAVVLLLLPSRLVPATQQQSRVEFRSYARQNSRTLQVQKALRQKSTVSSSVCLLESKVASSLGSQIVSE